MSEEEKQFREDFKNLLIKYSEDIDTVYDSKGKIEVIVTPDGNLADVKIDMYNLYN